MSGDCPDGLEIVRGLQARAKQAGIPLAGGVALTHRCNFRCVHCYASGGGASAVELDTAQWLRLIDELAEAGCLFLLVTGGEPLLRRDFTKLYTRIRERGMLPALFTNGSLVDDNLVSLLKDMPPRAVDITLYGATEETYRRVTGVSGMQARVWAAVERLLESGIRVMVKTVIMTLNRHEFDAIERQAKAWGVRFRMDAAIFSRLNGDRAPLGYRVDPREVAELEFADPRRARQWQDYVAKHGKAPTGDRLYICGAGVWSFHIDAEGNLLPCMMASHIRRSVAGSPFRAGWDAIRLDMAARKRRPDSKCATCPVRVLCGYCPPYGQLGTGDETQCSEYLCLLGKARSDRMMFQKLDEVQAHA